MYKQIILKANLTPAQAEIMEFLYLHKNSRASVIAKKINRSRAIVYKELEVLEKLNLVEKYDTKNKVSIFNATHPDNLQELFKQREKELKKDQELFNATLPQLISDFKLKHSQPGIKFFEGINGIEQVLNDTLKTKTTILSYADLEAINKYLPEVNKKYAKKREKYGIKKRGIVIDTPFVHKFLKNYFSEITETHLISEKLFPFGSIMQIYDNKISYISLSDENLIGIIIEDQNIATMHRSLFELTWQNTKEFKSSS